jgi:hypothetical protein
MVETPQAFGGASVAYLTAIDAVRIQQAADEAGVRLTLVGSRAAGRAGPCSDFDYILEKDDPTVRLALRLVLPEGPRLPTEPRKQDFLVGPVDPARPHIVFWPRPR